MSTPLLLADDVVMVNCLHTAVGASIATLNDGADGTPTLGAGEQSEIISSSVDDDVGGTGATGWGLVYLDSNGDVQVETGEMDGTTGVLTVATDICRHLDFWCTDYGSGGTNAGAITIRNPSTLAGRVQIQAERRRAGPALFTIPSGYFGTLIGANLVVKNTASAAPTRASVMIQADIDPATGEKRNGNFFTNLSTYTTGISKPAFLTTQDASMNIYLPELVTVRARGQVNASNCEISGAFYIRLTQVPDYSNF